MDQTDFRKLLATPKPGGSSTTSSASARTFGASNKRKADPTSLGSSKATHYDFKPRKTQKTNPDGSTTPASNPHKPKASLKNSATGESYMDRAEARRKGLDDEFAEVERLRQELEKRAESGEIAKEELEEQMRFLGGDAKHSILVKGLDYALLAQNKAKAESSANDGNVDDDLEAAFESSKSNHSPHSSSSSSNHKDRESRKESLLEAIKKNKESKGQKLREEEEIKKNSKFKPIGLKKVEVRMDTHSSGDKKIGKDGKKLRKKKKKPEGSEETNGEAAKLDKSDSKNQEQKVDASFPQSSLSESNPAGHSNPSQPSIPASSSSPNEPPALESEPSKPPFNSTEEKAPEPEPEPTEEDDVEIFSDAGSWKGLPLGDGDDDDDSGEEDTTADPNLEEIESSKVQKRDWFSTSKPGEIIEEKKSIESAALPGNLEKLLSSATSKRSPGSSGEKLEKDGFSRSPSPQGASEHPTGMRLQGLSDSNLPGNMGKLLLEHDLQREKRKEEWEKKNKAKKGDVVEEENDGEGQDGKEAIEKIDTFKGKGKKGKGRRRRDDDDDDD